MRRVEYVHVGNERDVVHRGVEHILDRDLARGQIHLVCLALEDRARVCPNHLLLVIAVVRHTRVWQRNNTRSILGTSLKVLPLPQRNFAAVGVHVHLAGPSRETLSIRHTRSTVATDVVHLAVVVVDKVVHLRDREGEKKVIKVWKDGTDEKKAKTCSIL